jgi:hypothetical protein
MESPGKRKHIHHQQKKRSPLTSAGTAEVSRSRGGMVFFLPQFARCVCKLVHFRTHHPRGVGAVESGASFSADNVATLVEGGRDSSPISPKGANNGHFLRRYGYQIAKTRHNVFLDQLEIKHHLQKRRPSHETVQLLRAEIDHTRRKGERGSRLPKTCKGRKSTNFGTKSSQSNQISPRKAGWPSARSTPPFQIRVSIPYVVSLPISLPRPLPTADHIPDDHQSTPCGSTSPPKSIVTCLLE